jgi:hypothetical protein
MIPAWYHSDNSGQWGAASEGRDVDVKPAGTQPLCPSDGLAV